MGNGAVSRYKIESKPESCHGELNFIAGSCAYPGITFSWKAVMGAVTNTKTVTNK
jgi:hypothetical protein